MRDENFAELPVRCPPPPPPFSPHPTHRHVQVLHLCDLLLQGLPIFLRTCVVVQRPKLLRDLVHAFCLSGRNQDVPINIRLSG